MSHDIKKSDGMTKTSEIPDYNDLFAPKDKEALFDDLAKLYYEGQKFGTASKSEIDLIMFKHYFMRVKEWSKGHINGYSDFLISQELGITESRVSNLKVKTELRYQYLKSSWKTEFAKLLPNARVEDGKVKLYIPEKSIYLKIKNEIEIKGEFIDIQLNGKLLQVPVKSFTAVIVGIVDSETYTLFVDGIKRIKGLANCAEDSVREAMEKTKMTIATQAAFDIAQTIANLVPKADVATKLCLELKKLYDATVTKPVSETKDSTN